MIAGDGGRGVPEGRVAGSCVVSAEQPLPCRSRNAAQEPGAGEAVAAGSLYESVQPSQPPARARAAARMAACGSPTWGVGHPGRHAGEAARVCQASGSAPTSRRSRRVRAGGLVLGKRRVPARTAGPRERARRPEAHGGGHPAVRPGQGRAHASGGTGAARVSRSGPAGTSQGGRKEGQNGRTPEVGGNDATGLDCPAAAPGSAGPRGLPAVSKQPGGWRN